MYQIYADQTLIYDDESDDKSLRLVNPKLSIADSSAGSLTMTVPPGNAGYNSIVRMKTDITIMKEGEIFWQGRVLQENKDFWNQRAMTCEGELAFFNDTIQPPHEYNYSNQMAVRMFLADLLEVHNTHVEANRRFTLGVVTVTAPDDTLSRVTNYETTISCLNEKLISKLGGHFYVRHENGVRYLDYLAEPLNLNTQEVNFGKNLIDFTRSFDSAEYATVLVPLGKRLDKEEGDPEDLEKYLTVESVNPDGSIYIERPDAIETYGRIIKVVHFDDIEDANTLWLKGILYLDDLQFDTMVIELSALDLHYLNPEIESVKVGDTIRVISAPHGLGEGKDFPVQKMEIPLDKPENTLFTLGTEVRTSLTAESSKTNQALKEKIDAIETVQSEVDPDAILAAAQQNAQAMMDQTLNGYVTLETSNTGGKHSEALFISESKPVLPKQNGRYQARRFWKWSLSGLGYTDDYGETWKTAINMDGSILGERIAANSIHGNRITTGTLTLTTSAGDAGCLLYLRAVEGGTTTTMASAYIQINGMVTFSNLNDPDTTSGGSRTFIDGGHIRAETMDLSSLRVKEVWYNDPTDGIDYKMFEAYADLGGAPIYTLIGPKDLPYSHESIAYWTNTYGNYICFGRPGSGIDLLHNLNALVFDCNSNTIYTNGTTGRSRWKIGSIDGLFEEVCAFYFTTQYGTLMGTRNGPVWMDENGRTHYLAYDE